MSVFTSATVEIEFSAGIWTDVSAYYALERGITISQGRPTEFEEVSAGMLRLTLRNDDGRFMPDNTGSPHYPNVIEGKRIRFKVTKVGIPMLYGSGMYGVGPYGSSSGGTYTRFNGWIQSWEPDFPTANTTGATVLVTATDALGLLAQRRLRSNWTETALWRARADGTHCDAYEAAGQANGMYATLTNYSQDANPGVGGPAYSSLLPILSFSSDQNVSIGGIVSTNPDSNGYTCGATMDLQSGNLEIQFLLKCPTALEGGGTPRYVCATFISGGGNLCSLVIQNNGGSNALFLYDATLATNLGIVAQLPYGQWVMVRMVQNSVTATRMDVWCTYELVNFNASILSNANIDIRNIIRMQIPGGPGRFLSCSWGGIVALGTRTQIDPGSAVVGAGGGSVGSRITSLSNAVNQLPIGIGFVGAGYLNSVANGIWSDRSALDVGREIMRSVNGVLWARPVDGFVCAITADALRPPTPLLTLDLDGDAIGAPRLIRSVDSRPTRVQVDSPAGSTLVIDTAAEAAGNGSPQRLKTVNTVNTVTADARAVANQLLAQASRTRISQFTADLVGAETDPTAILFDASTTLGGLYPTQRIRLTVPASHFGTSTRDVLVQGWEEQYDDRGARIIMDTTPVITTVLASESFTGANGAAFPAQWVAGATGTGGTATILGNQGRISAGTAASVNTSRRFNIATVADLDYSGLITFNQAQGIVAIVWRGDAALSTNNYYLRLDTSGTLYLRKTVAGAITSLVSWAFTVTAGVQYRWRVRSTGTLQLAKVWDASAFEPNQWDGVASDASQATGYVGMNCINDAVAAARTFDFDDILLTDGR